MELGAGCGLPSVVLSRLGANVVATDLAENLELLSENVNNNFVAQSSNQSKPLSLPLRCCADPHSHFATTAITSSRGPLHPSHLNWREL